MKPFDSELQPIKLSNLKILCLTGFHSTIKIKSICDFAFYECDKIEFINLTKNNIRQIKENTFHFRCENDKFLEINLYGNQITELNFEFNSKLNSLVNFKRPTKLYLD